jgi:hypothetical protein
MGECDKEGHGTVTIEELSNDELAAKFADIVARDSGNLTHIQIAHRKLDKSSDKIFDEPIGNIFADSTGKRFLLLFSDNSRALVITPKGGQFVSDTEEDAPVKKFHDFIHYSTEDSDHPKFRDGVVTYSDSDLTNHGITNSDIATIFKKRGMLLADSNIHTHHIVKETMKATFAYGTKRLSMQ